MGLSNEERFAKMVHSVCHINELSADLGERYPVDQSKLKKLCERLWYDFLKADSDGMFWFMGSDLSNDHLKGGLLGVAFTCHTPERGTTLESLTEERRKVDSYFDSYKTLSDFFDIDRLLSKDKRAVMLIYAHTQNIAYAMCRYKDEFMNAYEDLNFTMRTIQGECFKIFKEDKDYAHAWMLHHLCDKIYTIDPKDIVNQWWTKDCNSHHIHIKDNEFDTVFNLFKKYQFKQMTVQDRIDATLVLIGKRYGQYKHLHEAFMKQVEEYNKKHKKNPIATQPLVEAFERGQQAEKEEKSKPYERSCEFTGNYVDRKGEVNNWRHYGDNDDAPRAKRSSTDKRPRRRKR